MAKELTDFDFGTSKGGGRFPWEQWGNGNPWEVTEEDTDGSTLENFRQGLHARARNEGKGRKVRTHTPGPGRLIFQFYEPNGEAPKDN